MWLFDTSRWPARWHCGLWSDAEGWGTIGANVLIALAYWCIPFLGWWLLRRRPQIVGAHRILADWFLAFVVLCGTTHALDALMFWWPAYRVGLAARIATAAVSWVTLVLMWQRRWALAGYVSPEEHQRVVDAATEAIAGRERAERERDEEHRARLKGLERRERIARAQQVQLDALKAELEGILHRVLTDDDYTRLRARLHDLRGASQ